MRNCSEKLFYTDFDFFFVWFDITVINNIIITITIIGAIILITISLAN